jgi:hypothetical protein
MNSEQCTYLPGSEADCLPTLSSDIGQLSLLSGSHTPAKSYGNEQQKDGSPDCTCGKGTLECSIHPSTPEKWIAYMQDSLVRTLALLESRQAYLKEPDQVFTEKSCVLLASFDQNTCSWRTLQQSFLTDSELYSETWPRWGMTQGGAAYAHPMWERRITETDGSQWPTPRANSAMASTITQENSWNMDRFPNLETVVGRMMWPTPAARDFKGARLVETMIATGRNPQTNSLPDSVGEQSGLRLNPNWVSWLMNFPIGFAATHETMGFNSKESKNANAKKGNAHSALCELRESAGKEAIQFPVGGLDSIQEKEILRSSLHGESHDSRGCDVSRVKESFHEVSSEEMLRLWDAGEFACSSHGQQSGEQRTGELNDTLRFMSCEMALGEREGLIEDGEEMQTLRKASKEERAMQYPCESDVPTREPVNGSWWDTEPNIGRVATGVPNRVGKLKGYGNAQVPLQAATAWKLLGGE